MITDQMYGPQTAEVERLLERARHATAEENRACSRALADLPHDVWYPAVKRATDVSRGVAQPRYDGWDTVVNALAPENLGSMAPWLLAAWALVIRDLINPADFEVIVRPVVEVFGRCWEEGA